MAIEFTGSSGNWQLQPGDILVFKFSEKTILKGLVKKVFNSKALVQIGEGEGSFLMKVKKCSMISAEQAKENNQWLRMT
ncbi:MAG: hypothetical protein HGGPFJEG_03092 [Ignavibacteria bacterium]|nr:hypothetical protein [Ignavibacteria bacterium]